MNDHKPEREAVRVMAKWALVILLLPAGITTTFVFYTVAQGNFHAVSEGRIYRSGQLNAGELKYYIEKYRIKSILNLRGENKASGWYQEEAQIAKTHSVLHYDYGISAIHEVDDQSVTDILHIIRASPKPLLIHCNWGSDRTGLISALSMYAIEGKTPREADHELSVFYGHFPYLWSNSGAMDRTFWRYVESHAPGVVNR